jgi:hypothetical protein
VLESLTWRLILFLHNPLTFVPLAAALPISGGPVRNRGSQCSEILSAVALAVMIFAPDHFVRILMKVLAADMVARAAEA